MILLSILLTASICLNLFFIILFTGLIKLSKDAEVRKIIEKEGLMESLNHEGSKSEDLFVKIKHNLIYNKLL